MKYFLRVAFYIVFPLDLRMAKKKKTGGRNPVSPENKVIQVNFYVKQSVVDFHGGMEKARSHAKNVLELEANYYTKVANEGKGYKD